MADHSLAGYTPSCVVSGTTHSELDLGQVVALPDASAQAEDSTDWSTSWKKRKFELIATPVAQAVEEPEPEEPGRGAGAAAAAPSPGRGRPSRKAAKQEIQEELDEEDYDEPSPQEAAAAEGDSLHWVQCSRCEQWRVVPDDQWPDIENDPREDWFCEDARWNVTTTNPWTPACPKP